MLHTAVRQEARFTVRPVFLKGFSHTLIFLLSFEGITICKAQGYVL